MARDYVVAQDLFEIAVRLKDKYPTNLADVDLDKLLVVREINTKPKKYAHCRKMDDLFKFLHPGKDFVIVVFHQCAADFTPAQLNLLIFHEMLHIAYKENRDGDLMPVLRDHDVQEFFVVGASFGLSWKWDPLTRDILECDEKDLYKKPENYDDDKE